MKRSLFFIDIVYLIFIRGRMGSQLSRISLHNLGYQGLQTNGRTQVGHFEKKGLRMQREGQNDQKPRKKIIL